MWCGLELLLQLLKHCYHLLYAGRAGSSQSLPEGVCHVDHARHCLFIGEEQQLLYLLPSRRRRDSWWSSPPDIQRAQTTPFPRGTWRQLEASYSKMIHFACNRFYFAVIEHWVTFLRVFIVEHWIVMAAFLRRSRYPPGWSSSLRLACISSHVNSRQTLETVASRTSFILRLQR